MRGQVGGVRHLRAVRRHQHVEQAGGPPIVAERFRLFGHGFAQPAQQDGASFQAHHRIGFAHLEDRGQVIGDQCAQAGGVGLQRTILVAGKEPADERVEAGHREPFGAGEGLSAGRFDIFPVGASAGVEQHADDGQVDHGVGAQRRVLAPEQAVEFGLAVDAAGFEVAPAAVEGNVQFGIALFGGRDNGVRRVGDAVVMHRPPLRFAAAGPCQQLARAFPDGLGGAQDVGRALRLGAADGAGGHGASPRPLAFFSSSASGTGPGVK